MSGNRKPRIVFLNHWARELGGAEHSLLDMLRMVRNVFETHLVTTEPGPLVDKALSLGVSCHIVPCKTSVKQFRRWNLLKNLFLTWPAIPAFLVYCMRLRKVIKNIQPHLIHGNVPKAHMALFFLVRTGFTGKSCIHVREIFEKRSLSVNLYRLFFPGKNCTVIAISKSVKNNLPSAMQSKADIIYNGIRIPPRPKKYLKNGAIKLLYLGRIVPWKGCHLLIDIFSRIRERFPQKQLELSLIGDTMYWTSEYKNQLQGRIDSLNLSQWCRLLPYTDDPDSAFKTYDIFCNASLNEPFGRVMAEAQASGMPVVAFDSGGVSEIVKNGSSGMLVPYNDLEKFTDALSRLIQEPDLIKKMGLQGRKDIQVNFDLLQQGPLFCEYFSRQVSLQ